MFRTRYCCGPLYVCSYCKECKEKERWLTDVLITNEYQHRVPPSIYYACLKDTLRERREKELRRERQLRLEFARNREQEHRMQEQRMLKQRQQQEQRNAQKREKISGELGEALFHFSEKQFQRDFDVLVQNLQQEWELKPEPPKARQKELRFVRHARSARPLPPSF